MNWRTFNDQCNRLANALVQRGVKKNDKVVILFHNRPEFLVSNFAIQKCGAIPVR